MVKHKLKPSSCCKSPHAPGAVISLNTIACTNGVDKHTLQKALPRGIQCWRGEGKGRDGGKLSKGVYGSACVGTSASLMPLWSCLGHFPFEISSTACSTLLLGAMRNSAWAYGSTKLSDTKYVARGVCLWSQNHVERTKLHLQGHTGTSWRLDPIFGLFV